MIYKAGSVKKEESATLLELKRQGKIFWFFLGFFCNILRLPTVK